jgi:hypothetical protein
MSVIDSRLPTVRGRVDSQGRLIEADVRLDDLNKRAGGGIGAPIAVPQLATLARLAQRLGILVSRSVIAADGDNDLELWVRAMPEGNDGGVALHITGWRTRPAWTPPADDKDRDLDFVRSAASWVWETDSSLRLTYISVGAGARHGFDAAGLLGQPLTKLFVLGEDAEGDFPILDALAMRERFENQPADIRATGLPVRLSATPRVDASGGFTGFFGATVMAEPGEARTRLVPEGPMSGLPDAFTSRLDRALRTPLNRIIANADSINAQSEGPLRQDYADYAADIATAGRHLMGLIDDLVDLQAVERPGFKTLAEPIDLADVARRAAGLLAVRAGVNNVRIDKPTEIDALPAIGEFRRALQVLVNLVGNAVRYSPESGMVWIRTERADNMAAVIVADQGRGIALEDQARIFEKFERVDTSEQGGSGLGLYIARRLARAMGGDVTVDSAPGQGARFVFTLPYRDTPAG